jgi:ATP-binding cassette subfamily B protein
MDNAPQPPTAERGKLSALLRLWPYARRYRGWLVLTVLSAMLASLSQLAVPLIISGVVDGPLADGDAAGLVPYIVFALLFGVA